jgi:hypothetical protein
LQNVDTAKASLQAARDKHKMEKIAAGEKALDDVSVAMHIHVWLIFALHQAESQVQERRAFLEGISVSALDEIAKFTKEKDELLKKLIISHLKTQIDYAEKVRIVSFFSSLVC